MRGIFEFHRNGKIQPGGTTAQTNDFQTISSRLGLSIKYVLSVLRTKHRKSLKRLSRLAALIGDASTGFGPEERLALNLPTKFYANS
jgi:hypothetical protein